MNLRPLCSAPNVDVYFDSWNNFLYLEWAGELQLAAVQQACLEIARCFVAHAYPRVLNNNAQIVRVEPDVTPWLAQHFLPYLGLAGVQQFAWVYGPSPRGQELGQQVLRFLSPQVQVALFADAEEAVAWLQQMRPGYTSGCELLPRPPAAQHNAKLKFLLKSFEQEVAATRVAPAPATPARSAGHSLLLQ